MDGPYAAFLKAQAAKSAALIKGMPFDLANQATEFIMQESVKGMRAGELAQALREKFPDMAGRKAELIARTEANKTHTAIVEARAGRLNLPWYEWSAVVSGTTRPGHRKLSGVLVSWRDPPSPEALAGEKKTYGKYHAGEIFNCRCEPMPLIEAEDVSWPRKVYAGGEIRTLGLKEFKRL
jgi:SPP1 gp7 family putative phage head morphogenesis protein